MREKSIEEQEDRSPISIFKYLIDVVGMQKLSKSKLNVIVLGILAGIYIGFGAIFLILVSCDANDYIGFGLSRMISGIVFSLAIILIVVAGAELFTGNNLLFLNRLEKKTSTLSLVKFLLLIYIANIFGAAIFAFIIYLSNIGSLNGNAVGLQALTIANAKVNLTWGEAFVRGIACNWLVCLAIWMSAGAKSIISKIFAIVFPITAFVALGFEHSIANAFYISYGILLKNTNLAFLFQANTSNLNLIGFINNLIPVTLGNLMAGTLFVAAAYWLAFRQERSN